MTLAHFHDTSKLDIPLPAYFAIVSRPRHISVGTAMCPRFVVVHARCTPFPKLDTALPAYFVTVRIGVRLFVLA